MNKIIGALAICFFVQFSLAANPSCNCVAFRMDDIQDWWLSGCQRSVLNAFRDNGIPLTAGIIANSFGRDSVMLGYFKDVQSNYKTWDLEIASHGWNHEDFSTFTAAQQMELLVNSTTRITSLLGINRLDTFIPPFNNFNTDTMNALTYMNYTHISSSSVVDPAPYYLSGKSFYHYPEAAATSDESVVNVLPYYVGIPAATTLSQVQAQINNYGFAVIMVHPMEFGAVQNNANADVLNTTQYNELISLFSMLKTAGINITTINKINTAPVVATTSTTSGTTTTSTTGTTSTTSTTSSTSGTTSTTSTTSSTSSTTGSAPVTSTTGTPSTTTTGKSTTTGSAPVTTTGTPATTAGASTTGSDVPATTTASGGNDKANSTTTTTGCNCQTTTTTGTEQNESTTGARLDIASDAQNVVANIGLIVAAITAILA